MFRIFLSLQSVLLAFNAYPYGTSTVSSYIVYKQNYMVYIYVICGLQKCSILYNITLLITLHFLIGLYFSMWNKPLSRKIMYLIKVFFHFLTHQFRNDFSGGSFWQTTRITMMDCGFHLLKYFPGHEFFVILS